MNCKIALMVIGLALADSTGPFNGGPCPNNSAVAGACASYGDQCTYFEPNSGTHYCTCLVSSPSSPGVSGWSCH